MYCLTACGQPGAVVSSRVQALADAPYATAPNPLAWIETSSAELDEASSSDPQPPIYVPSDDLQVARLQAWSDELYDRLVSSKMAFDGVLLATAKTPRPRVRIKVSSDVNGYVSNAAVCLKLNIKLADASDDAAAGLGQVVSIDTQGRLGLTPHERTACIDRSAEATAAAEVAAYFLEHQQIRNCRISEDAGALILGAGCTQPSGTAMLGADYILTYASGTWITLTTGLIAAAADEGAVLTALSHELGHYYRSHGSRSKSSYQYFYTNDDASHTERKPVMDPGQSALGAKLLKLSKVRVQDVPGQQLSSWMFTYMPTLASNLVAPACRAATASCHAACAPWLEFFASPQIKQALGAFPQGQLAPMALAHYWRYEQLTQACFAAVSLSDKASSGDGAVTRGAAKAVLWKASVDSLRGDSLWSPAAAMNATFRSEELSTKRLLQQAVDDRLGFYTTEQEADDLGLTFLEVLGVDPLAAVSYWFAHAERTSAKHLVSEYDFGVERCRALYAATPRWSAAGRAVRVPIGSFGDPHHSACYRIYHLDRRIEARN